MIIHYNLRFENISTLTVSKAGYTWNDLESVLQLFPNLETLIASGNNIDGFNQSVFNGLAKLKHIDLSDNPITSFESLARKLMSVRIVSPIKVI